MSDLYCNDINIEELIVNNVTCDTLYMDDVYIDISSSLPVFACNNLNFTIPEKWRNKFNVTDYVARPMMDKFRTDLEGAEYGSWNVSLSRSASINNYDATTGNGTIKFSSISHGGYAYKTFEYSFRTPYYLCPVSSAKGGAIEI